MTIKIPAHKIDFVYQAYKALGSQDQGMRADFCDSGGYVQCAYVYCLWMSQSKDTECGYTVVKMRCCSEDRSLSDLISFI